MSGQKKSIIPSIFLAFTVFLIALSFYYVLYNFDNKYTAGPPYGNHGSLTFSDEDLHRPVFLIDDWELYPDQIHEPSDFQSHRILPEQYTFIGQYPNFSFFNQDHSPFGKATYRMLLHYSGVQSTLALEVPEIFSDYTLWVDGQAIASTGDDGIVSFTAKETSEVILNVENDTHYYSGLTYPPAVGTVKMISHMLLVRSILYGILCLLPLSFCILSAASLATKGYNRRLLHFGLLSLFSCIHSAYPFVHWLGATGTFWYAVEDISSMAALCEIAALCAMESDVAASPMFRKLVRPVTIFFCFFAGIAVLFLIPSFPSIITPYGYAIDGYKLLCFAYFVFSAGYGILHCEKGSSLILAACAAAGSSLAVNVWHNNRFEPIYGLWQAEWVSLLFIVVFGFLTLQHIRDLLYQNQQLTEHLSSLVETRTQELQTVLQERKTFFSNLAHDMKAPIAAIHGFIGLIERGNLYLDDDLKSNLSRISSENQELSRRIQALNDLTAFDKIADPPAPIRLKSLLTQVYEDNEPETCANGISFILHNLEQEVFVMGVQKKLLILFENMIYNAISFTPEDGVISLSAEVKEKTAVITLSDTGTGIQAEALPHVFERFYTNRKIKNEGSGLGLYIVKLTVEEMGGTIQVASPPGKGTVFTICLPICQHPRFSGK